MRSIRLREVASLNVKIRQKSTKILNIEQFFRIHSCETILCFSHLSFEKLSRHVILADKGVFVAIFDSKTDLAQTIGHNEQKVIRPLSCAGFSALFYDFLRLFIFSL